MWTRCLDCFGKQSRYLFSGLTRHYQEDLLHLQLVKNENQIIKNDMNGDFREDLKRACEVMQKGGVILYPTDTIWGIGCDATNPGGGETSL